MYINTHELVDGNFDLVYYILDSASYASNFEG